MILSPRRSLAALLLSLAIGLPASAQQTLNQLTAQQNELWAQQQAADQRALAQRGEQQAQEARAETEARLAQLRAQTPPYRDADPVYAPKPAAGSVPLSQISKDFPSIPAKALAASRARVLAASANRR
jgi:hypothetical protein